MLFMVTFNGLTETPSNKSPQPSIGYWVIKNGENIDYIYQGKKNTSAQLKQVLKGIYKAMGGEIRILLQIDNNLNIFELTKELRLLKSLKFKTVTIVNRDKNPANSSLLTINLKNFEFGDHLDIIQIGPPPIEK